MVKAAPSFRFLRGVGLLTNRDLLGQAIKDLNASSPQTL